MKYKKKLRLQDTQEFEETEVGSYDQDAATCNVCTLHNYVKKIFHVCTLHRPLDSGQYIMFSPFSSLEFANYNHFLRGPSLR